MSIYCFDYKINFYNKRTTVLRRTRETSIGHNLKNLGNLSYLSGMLTNEIMLIILVYKGLSLSLI